MLCPRLYFLMKLNIKNYLIIYTQLFEEITVYISSDLVLKFGMSRVYFPVFSVTLIYH
jgi:hypothetical protein